MKGQVFRRCTKCGARRGTRSRECSECGAASFSWYYVVDIGTGPDGRRRRRKRGGFDTKQACEKALREVLVDLDENRLIEPSDKTVQQFLIDEWLPAVKLTLAASTWEGYRGIIERYILPRIGEASLGDLRAPRINWLYADVRDNGRLRGDGPLSLKTVREVHVVLHRALEDAVAWEYLASNPAARANPPSATAAKNERTQAIQTWTAEQVQAFAAHIADHPLFPLWLLAASTGMRRSELLGLRWRDIDFERRLVAIRQVLVTVGGTPQFKDAPKTQHGYRTLRLPARVVRVLRQLKRDRTDNQPSHRTPDASDVVFARPDGRPWHPDHITETIGELIDASGLPRIRPLQDLRHTHATLLLADGENAKVVQERLGHHSHSFTADTYQHVMPGMDEAAAERFDGLVFGDDPDNEPDGG